FLLTSNGTNTAIDALAEIVECDLIIQTFTSSSRKRLSQKGEKSYKRAMLTLIKQALTMPPCFELDLLRQPRKRGPNLLAPRRRLLRQPKANNFSHKLGPRVREDDVPLVNKNIPDSSARARGVVSASGRIDVNVWRFTPSPPAAQ